MATLQKNNPTLGLEVESVLNQFGQQTPLIPCTLSNAQKIKKISAHFSNSAILEKAKIGSKKDQNTYLRVAMLLALT